MSSRGQTATNRFYGAMLATQSSPACAICSRIGVIRETVIHGRGFVSRTRRCVGFNVIWMGARDEIPRDDAPPFEWLVAAALVCDECFHGHWTEGRSREERFASVKLSIRQAVAKRDLFAGGGKRVTLTGGPGLKRRRTMMIGGAK